MSDHYQAKPVPVLAWQYAHGKELPEWMKNAGCRRIDITTIHIPRASEMGICDWLIEPGEWIVFDGKDLSLVGFNDFENLYEKQQSPPSINIELKNHGVNVERCPHVIPDSK